MKKKADTPKKYIGNKKRVYAYLKECKTAKTSDIVFDLRVDAKEAWKIINELEAEGVIFTRL